MQKAGRDRRWPVRHGQAAILVGRGRLELVGMVASAVRLLAGVQNMARGSRAISPGLGTIAVPGSAGQRCMRHS
jgi:hypothetical protein